MKLTPRIGTAIQEQLRKKRMQKYGPNDMRKKGYDTPSGDYDMRRKGYDTANG